MIHKLAPYLAAGALAAATAACAVGWATSGPAAEKPTGGKQALVALFHGLHAHQWNRVCQRWHPAYWFEKGISPEWCHQIVAASFSGRYGHWDYHIFSGGESTPNGEAWIVQIASDTNTYPHAVKDCEPLWADGKLCRKAQSFVFKLILSDLRKDFGYAKGYKAGTHWYVWEAGPA